MRCEKCGLAVREIDGSVIGAFSGVAYLVCKCGYVRPKIRDDPPTPPQAARPIDGAGDATAVTTR